MDPDEEGLKSNRNTYILFTFCKEFFWFDDGTSGLNFYDDSGRSPLAD